ncbi:MAG: endonuclease, partial [Paludibacteraceae bacterium]|nr:endonuclease [Paludibacteraceae bacterium]
PEQLYTTSEQYYQSTGYRSEGPYKSPTSNGTDDGWDFDEDDEIPDYPDGPMPIGDGLWVLLVLAAAYGIIRMNKSKIMKKINLLLLLTALTINAWAVDENYYSELNGKSGDSLVTAVQNVLRTHLQSTPTYTPGIWQAYCEIDVRPDGYIWDIYSESNQFVPGGPAQGATIRGVGTSYNREHSIPKSWFGGGTKTNTPGADLMHIFPVDGYINSTHNNLPYGEVAAQGAKTFSNSTCLCGTAEAITVSGIAGVTDGSVSYGGSSKVFEPTQAYKGDLARGYFATLLTWADLDDDNADEWDYQPFTKEYGQYVFSGNYTAAGLYGFTPYGIALMMQWTRSDAVSAKEINRNNGVERIQGNRNPFIDLPELAEYIWGNKAGQEFQVSSTTHTWDPESYTPTDKQQVTVTWMFGGSVWVRQTVDVGSALTLPGDVDGHSEQPAACDGRAFKGWTEEEHYFNPTHTPADMFTSAEGKVVTHNVTYYAVFGAN